MDMEYLGDSSCVESAGYEAGYLTIEFKDGTVYTYEDVDQYTWRSFKQSVSKGYFFNKQIRNNFNFIYGNAPDLSLRTKIYDKVMEGIDTAVQTAEEFPIE